MMTIDKISGAPACERILGIPFFNGNPAAAFEYLERHRGCLITVPSPALIKLHHDELFRRTVLDSDVVLADSGLLVFLWKLITGRRLNRISGFGYLRALLDRPGAREEIYWVVASPEARDKTLAWLAQRSSSAPPPDIYIFSNAEQDEYALLQKLEHRKPRHIVIALSGGVQEKLGLYLRSYLLYRPQIHCVGAALGFLTGDEPAIPERADRWSLGWLWRLLSQPRMFLPRLAIALRVTAMVLRYRDRLPPLRRRWADR